MKLLYYDCFSGISGDMNLGAMIDLGIEVNYLEEQLSKLKVEGWKLEVAKDQRHGINGTKVTVKQTRHEHKHRHLSDIRNIINVSDLDPAAKELSLKIFMKLAEAEARVHGISIEKVHFHEVGAIDSIVDIVGAAVCFLALGVDRVHVAPVELGGGMVRCEHGLLPVPAPATAEIIKGIPVKHGGVGFEATTPTGASILAALGTSFGNPPELKIVRTAYGIGQKENPELPNVLRVYLCESAETDKTGHEAVLLECNIDDMNPELYGYISEKLFNSGASDVFLTNTIMKKGRPGVILSIICEKGNEESLKEIVFTESTTIGIRLQVFVKDTLVRNFETVDTPFGKVTYKRSFYKGREVSCKPEAEDCRKIAEQTGRPLKEIYSELNTFTDHNKKTQNA